MAQRLRDEAHRFAITYHRQRRSKRSFSSVLDSIPGIGEKRKRQLIRHFGSIKGINDASVGEISKIPSIDPKLAKVIKSSI